MSHFTPLFASRPTANLVAFLPMLSGVLLDAGEPARALRPIAASVSISASAVRGASPPRHSFRVTSEGGVLDALSVGNGPPIIAIAGGPGISSAYLRDTLPRLAHHTLVFYDPRGSGASQSGVRPLSFASAVAEIEDLRLALDAEQVVLLAHSYGALPACVYAARRPRRVRALVLVSPAGLDWQAWQRDLAALQARVSRIRPAQHVTTRGCDHFVAAMERRLPAYFCDPGCARRVRLSGASGDLNRAVLAELGRFDLRLDMEAMPDSILIVWGRYDWIGGETREQWSRTLPQAHVVELGGSGHFPFVEEPEPFLGALVGFLETPSQQSSRIP